MCHRVASDWFSPGPGDFILAGPLGGVLEAEKPEPLGVLGVVVLDGAAERDPLVLHSGERDDHHQRSADCVVN